MQQKWLSVHEFVGELTVVVIVLRVNCFVFNLDLFVCSTLHSAS